VYRLAYRLMRLLRPREFLSLSYLGELERNQWLSQDDLRDVEWRKLKRLLDHAYENVPFYRERFRRAGFAPTDIRTMEDFHQIPLLTKDDIRAHGEDLIARNYSINRMRRYSTSGSTGIPIAIYHDYHSVPIVNAALIRSRRWFGVEPGDKTAWIWGRRDDLPADTWSARLITTLKRERWLNAYRVSDEEMQRFAEILVEWQPSCLVGYATSMYLFACYISDRRITGIRPQAVETTAGTLWPHERQRIEETFGCGVFDRYGSHETGHIAAQCEHGQIHVFSDVCHVEVIRDGRPREGGIGEIVTTPLYSYGMPLIRYCIGDVGVLETHVCACGRGFPILREVVGRTNSIFTLPSGKYLYGGIFRRILDDILEIERFRVHQTARDEIEIVLKGGDGFSRETIEQVRARATDLLSDEPVNVSILVTDGILPTASGKYLVTTSDVPVDFVGRT
jgi:phenylacetate-CoA ligase